MKLIWTIFLILSLSGCVKPIHMTIDAYSCAEAMNRKNHFLIVTEKSLESGELQSKEFQGMTEQVLADVGFSSADKEDANVGILLDYGITDPIISQYTYSSPVYGQTGIATSQTSGNVYSYSNCATYSQQTTYTPQYGVVGYETKVGTLVTYVRHLSLTGFDMDKFRAEGDAKELWRLHVSSVGETGDLRRIFPVLLAGAKKYIGVSTGQKIELRMYETNEEVSKIKGMEQ